MQYINEIDAGKPVAMLADLVKAEPVAVRGAGGDMVVMSLEEYERIQGKNRGALIQSMRRLSEEARKNGLTEEKLAELLSDVS